VAVGLAACGADVAVTSRSEAALADVASDVVEKGAQVLTVPASVEDPDAVAGAADRIRAAWGGLDVLVNCAGISPVFTGAETLDVTTWRAVIDTNLTGAFLCCREAAALMLEGDGGSIVNVSSIHATAGMPRLVAYSASKGAVEAMTRTLALEWAPRGVRVNAVAPGYFETEMTEGLRASPRWRADLLGRIPLGRFGRPAELVPAVLFLASAGEYVTGTTLVVDGGWTAA
jgi:NAD(P)-dependent dehydrogenase (short-subunit alcohol dehydrogenase family)